MTVSNIEQRISSFVCKNKKLLLNRAGIHPSIILVSFRIKALSSAKRIRYVQ